MDKRNFGKSSPVYVLALCLSLGIVALGVYLAASAKDWTVFSAGFVGFVAVLVTWPLERLFVTAKRLDFDRQDQQISTMRDRLQEISVLLQLMSEQQLISDRAKSVAFRENDREALRRAIREEIAKGDFEIAMALANDMETTFGLKEEAERVREEVKAARDEAFRHEIHEQITVIDRFCRAEQWNEALQEAQKIIQQHPNSDIVRNLPQEIETRQLQHKKQLMDSWQDAINRNDVDGGVELLKRLDRYLTRSEAEAMEDSARSLFREKLNRMRMSFALAVQDHKWSDAVRIGEEIIRDFPNSGIAREVREKMDALRQRASEPEEAKV